MPSDLKITCKLGSSQQFEFFKLVDARMHLPVATYHSLSTVLVLFKKWKSLWLYSEVWTYSERKNFRYQHPFALHSPCGLVETPGGFDRTVGDDRMRLAVVSSQFHGGLKWSSHSSLTGPGPERTRIQQDIQSLSPAPPADQTTRLRRV